MVKGYAEGGPQEMSFDDWYARVQGTVEVHGKAGRNGS